MSKQETLNYFMGLVEDVKQGNRNALDVGPELKEFSDAISELYEEIKPLVVDERQKYSDKETIVRNGYEITTMSRGYPQYTQDKDLARRKELIKQATKKGRAVVDEETGEMVEPVDQSFSTYPVMKYVGNQILDQGN